MPTGVRRWKFTDLATGEVWTVPINPNARTSPWPDRNITSRSSTGGPGWGKPVVYEGARLPKDWTFSGTTLDLAHHNALLYWSLKPNMVKITDHFGWDFTVLLNSFDATPAQRYSHMQRHTYTMHVTSFWTAAPANAAPMSA